MYVVAYVAVDVVVFCCVLSSWVGLRGHYLECAGGREGEGREVDGMEHALRGSFCSIIGIDSLMKSSKSWALRFAHVVVSLLLHRLLLQRCLGFGPFNN